MKKIAFYTNLVYGGWSPRDLETGIGGSEEKLIELARELAKKHDVTIYMNGEHGDFDGVKYRAHKEFKAWDKLDLFVSFKARHILKLSINADMIVHWSTEIEPEWQEWELNNVDYIYAISNFHKSHFKQAETSYLWADLERLDKNKVKKKNGTMLYSSSYDRGLEELLANWGMVKEKLELDTLYITYGWEFIDKLIKTNPAMIAWKDRMLALMDQEGIEPLGKLTNDDMCKKYWESEYWALPLNNPQSELFCINAIKAQYCGAMPVVRRIGALQETVKNFIDWDQLKGEKASMSKTGKVDKKFASQFNLVDAVQRWEELLT